jgi:hypothetical protein
LTCVVASSNSKASPGELSVVPFVNIFYVSR